VTTSSFTITPTPPSSLKVEPGKEGKFSFTVTSLAAPDKVMDVLLEPRLIGADGKQQVADWLVPGPQPTMSMAGGKTETVTITARPTAKSPLGENTIKLVVADKDRPNDVFTESPPVTCEVVGPAVRPPDPHPRPSWLLPVIIAGAVVVLGGVVVLVLKLMNDGKPHVPGLGETCGSGASACDRGLLCKADVNLCLLAGGAHCEAAQAGQCASGECDDKNHVCAIPLGGACSPGEKDVEPCPRNSACDPATQKCLANVGAACKVDAECTSGACKGNVCVVKAPAVKPGDLCDTTCPDPLRCSTTTKRCVQTVGSPCDNNNQCDTGLCEQHACATPELLRNCTADAICGADQKCLEVQPNLKRCLWQPGHACKGDPECTSEWCNQGVCSRDDGKCTSSSECRSPYLCVTAKQRCFKPIGQICGGDAECETNFCNANRCAPSQCPPCEAGFVCNNATAKCVRIILRFPGVSPAFRFKVGTVK
jgi:hypothetical protein